MTAFRTAPKLRTSQADIAFGAVRTSQRLNDSDVIAELHLDSGLFEVTCKGSFNTVPRRHGQALAIARLKKAYFSGSKIAY